MQPDVRKERRHGSLPFLIPYDFDFCTLAVVPAKDIWGGFLLEGVTLC